MFSQDVAPIWELIIYKLAEAVHLIVMAAIGKCSDFRPESVDPWCISRKQEMPSLNLREAACKTFLFTDGRTHHYRLKLPRNP